ncbi:S41 family peptidase [Candidatus Roizmanbacteria bacterium CG_4_9_14_0_2_um_filter_39_13]|uniref:S41 family peptidase n=1 Tax=Candidatus Roizmanbacteria bacterium CG_4_9_14_0_2_um_filter_39_13 TaxID=1974839 RepID=A0A2M8F4J4_9BACT|nr:MAG: S41 family peptidase [Candidatus Roizmanbacteria bacterium CG_4_9_14_0_2_um_filter_39_13]
MTTCVKKSELLLQVNSVALLSKISHYRQITLMKLRSKKITDILLYISLGIFLFGSGYKLAEWRITNNSRDQLTYTVFNAKNNLPKGTKPENIDFSLYWDTWEKVESKFVDKGKIDPEKMFYGSIKGLVASVDDPYTFFLTPEENKQSKADLGGKFQGIGAQLGLKENLIVIIAPLKDSPAEKAGVLSGDIITKVDGESTEKWTLYQAVSKIRGPENTEVILTIVRASGEKDITIVRQEIKVPSIELTYEKSGGKSVAHIKINQFGDTTNTEWEKAAAEIAQKWGSKEITGMVLDVRGNPGGYLDSAVFIASEFIPQGEVVVKQESTNSTDRIYTVKRTGILLDIPMIVLINQGSASASEILAGALRDHKRAKLVGQKSFGKGSVQEALDLQQGAGLHVTVAKWLLPDGEWIHGKGIEPEFSIENEVDEENTLSNAQDAQLQKALELVVNKK